MGHGSLLKTGEELRMEQNNNRGRVSRKEDRLRQGADDEFVSRIPAEGERVK
jgi:hypothetical protein